MGNSRAELAAARARHRPCCRLVRAPPIVRQPSGGILFAVALVLIVTLVGIDIFALSARKSTRG